MIKRVMITLIVFYQKYLSFDTGLPKKLGISKGYVCMHYPTCSEYAKQAIDRYGVKWGLILGFQRVMRCRPGNDPSIDPLI